LAHIIISSSDGYFIETVYTDSRLKKTSQFFEINYLTHEDTMEWLTNIKKYSKIKDYTLNQDQAEKIWEVIGGSMWEIQYMLSGLFTDKLEDVLEKYKLQMRGIIVDYTKADSEKEKIFRLFLDKSTISFADVKDVPNFEELLCDMVKNNILYYDPTLAIFYPQGRSLEWGIKLYFNS